MVSFQFPKRWLNRAMVYAGIFGLVFQLCAAIFMLWHGMGLYSGWWFAFLAPLLCISTGLVPVLQLQQEKP